MEKEKHIEIGAALSPPPSPEDAGRTETSKHTPVWIVINIIATVAIVYINKSIFSDPAFAKCHFSFVAYHFTITGILLYIVRRASILKITPTETPLMKILPLSLIMCANIILMNLSLAYSSIVCYQIVRILLTPLTVLINLFFYNSKIPLHAAIALVPACLGVGLVTYADLLPRQRSLPSSPGVMDSTSALGIIYAFSGVFCSALYTVWVAHYHSRLNISSIQLLYRQAPFCAVFIGSISLVTDSFPVWATIHPHQWGLLLLSGGCACLINLSSFHVINRAGAVTSTVVGQLKTCLVIALGWMRSSTAMATESVLGVLLAVLGIVLYTAAMHKGDAR
ncbi:uncharacterized protein BO95DRAFT_457927 [Aspergillus brunneoviolaceus CBS 621.78]|uniref:Integral membrane protein n=1 Tax=Aspergillus brunneoviolaceus CBS 621.78 TaxID=1450534 RepID=A0ACD1FS04_9EURO|nr:integral membrane protein [Aspergillus brunneoviolaceus CBS 621.78]RAH39739.1 integral membrane protein [Aspergillus brunneoviolaceus CBS 621.78]